MTLREALEIYGDPMNWTNVEHKTGDEKHDRVFSGGDGGNGWVIALAALDGNPKPEVAAEEERLLEARLLQNLLEKIREWNPAPRKLGPDGLTELDLSEMAGNQAWERELGQFKKELDGLREELGKPVPVDLLAEVRRLRKGLAGIRAMANPCDPDAIVTQPGGAEEFGPWVWVKAKEVLKSDPTGSGIK